MIPDKNKPETIDSLLIVLQEAGFIYCTKVNIEEDEKGNVVLRKLRQIWFTHKEQLKAIQQFVADWYLIIDSTFNTNKDCLLLLIAVSILNSGHTFPICFSYCRSESDESFGLVWESLQEECFIPEGGLPVPPPPHIILGDQAGRLISSVPKAFPDCQVQSCNWHAVEAIKEKYRKSRYKKIEIERVHNKNN